MKRHLNLIPVATRRRQMVRRLSRASSRAIVAAGIVVGSMLALEWTQGMSSLRELKDVEARYAPVSQLLHEQARLVDRIQKLRGREQLSLRLSRDQYGLAVLGAVAQASGQSNGSVHVVQLDYQANADSEGAAAAAERSVQLEGAGVDSMAVADFAERLRESGVFSSVAVESTSPVSGGPNNLRRFEIACSL